MIEAEGARNDPNNVFGNDPFFNSTDDYDPTNLDSFDNTELFGLLNDDQFHHHHHLNPLHQQMHSHHANEYHGLDDLQLTTDAYLTSIPADNKDAFLSPISTSSEGQHTTTSGTQRSSSPANTDLPPPPSPIVIDPNEIDKISIQLEKNQQCRCKSCNKLFNSVWYLKQHAVKHSNDRPFKCKFCMKTYKFRSNLYQHKCPERNRQLGGLGGIRKRFYARGIAYTEVKQPPNSTPTAAQSLPVSLGGPDSKPAASQPPQSLFKDVQNPPLNTLENTAPESGVQFDINRGFNSQHQGYQQQLQQQTGDNPNIQFDLIPIDQPMQPIQQPFTEDFVEPAVNQRPKRPLNCIRQRPLDPAYIQEYLQKNKHRLFTCRKCKIQFSTKEHLNRHMTGHTLSEYYCYVCPQCPQKFCEEKRLINHLELHSKDASGVSHKCRTCEGGFRSALALRRHRDQCRMCYVYPYGAEPQMIISPQRPLDPYGFIESDEESEPVQKPVEATVLSDVSPPRSRFNLEEEYEEEKSPETDYFDIKIKRTKKTSENEDADSGFRSRLNSNQSCSPGATSSHSSGSDSPGRKYSNSADLPGTSGAGLGYGMSTGNNSNYPSSLGCFPQNRPSTIMSQNPAVNCGYSMLDGDMGTVEFAESFDLMPEEAGSGGSLLQMQPLFKQTRILKSMKSQVSAAVLFNFGLDSGSYLSPEAESFDLRNSYEDNGQAPIYGYDHPVDDEIDGDALKICIALFLNLLIANAKTKADEVKASNTH